MSLPPGFGWNRSQIPSCAGRLVKSISRPWLNLAPNVRLWRPLGRVTRAHYQVSSFGGLSESWVAPSFGWSDENQDSVLEVVQIQLLRSPVLSRLPVQSRPHCLSLWHSTKHRRRSWASASGNGLQPRWWCFAHEFFCRKALDSMWYRSSFALPPESSRGNVQLVPLTSPAAHFKINETRGWCIHRTHTFPLHCKWKVCFAIT